MKGYQSKLKKGIMIIKTLTALTSSTFKNRNIDNSELLIFLKSKNLSISSSWRKNNNHEKSYFKRDNNINNQKINNEENIYNYKNNDINNSNIDEIMIITKQINHRQTNIFELSTNRNLILNKFKKFKNKNNIVRSDFRQLCIHDNDLIIKKLVIINAENYQFSAKRNETSKFRNSIKHFYIGDRKFIFPGKFMNIYCNEIYIIKNQQISLPNNFKRVYLKIYLIFIIYFVILFYLMILIQNIQTKYGNNFYQICILPFVTTLLVKYLFSFNIMILITSLILFNFGEYFINNKKVPLLIYGISKVFISPVVINHYYAVKLYQHLK